VFRILASGVGVALAIAVPALAETIRVCPKSGGECTHSSLRRALADAKDGATVVIAPGVYIQGGALKANRVTIRAEEGAHLLGATAEGKAALVIRGRDTTVIGVECSGVEVPSGNGACIRQEGPNLTLRRVHFHHNQVGLLGVSRNGAVTIEDSIIADSGVSGEGPGHNVNVAGTALTIRRSKVLRARNGGHEVRSLAAKTTVENSTIASLEGADSRLIDLPLGGEVAIRNSILQKGPKSIHVDLIGFGPPSDRAHRKPSLSLVGNTILIDSPKDTVLLRSPPAAFEARDNAVIGGAEPAVEGFTWFADRASAGFPPFPALDRP
jgi:hypothetical protein